MNRAAQDQESTSQQDLLRLTVEAILASMSPQVADAVRLGAIPHWFDEDLLGRLAGDRVDMDQVVAYLRRLSFVRQDASQRFRYHDGVRDCLLEWWREERPDRYKEANRTALDHFSALAQAESDVHRPMYARQALYHQLILDETVGLQYLSEQFEAAAERYQLGLAEGFVAQAAELRDTLTDEGRLWLRYFEALLDLLYRRGDRGEATFQQLAERAPDPILQAVARWNLGQIRVSQRRWSEAVRLYGASLRALQREGALMYSARVMLSLGDAYRDLADSSGGFQRWGDEPSKAGRSLYILQHLPFLLYEWLVRHIGFLPDWYFGTNYQDWIIAYLLTEAARWYHRAAGVLREIGDEYCLAGARLSLAELEHQLGRWSRARQRYDALLATDQIRGSLYRTARVQLGQGRALLAEGDLEGAEAVLAPALGTFRRFQDSRSIGVAARLLGGIYAALGKLGEAASAYTESAHAFRAVGDHLAHTHVVWALEDLMRQVIVQSLVSEDRSPLTDEQRQQIEAILAEATERHYITRFPEALHRRFRRLALYGALPLSYGLAFMVVLVLTGSLAFIECEFAVSVTGANARTMLINALNLAAVATLPVLLVLWFYRLIYSLMGVAVVRILGHRLVAIEREQPSHLVTDTEGLTRHDVSSDSTHAVAWSDVSLLASVDYCQRRRPIDLVSATVLAAHSRIMLKVDALTAGYDRLREDIGRRLSQRPGGGELRNLDFVIFDGRWTLVAIAASLAVALYAVYAGAGGMATCVIESSGQEVTLLLSSILGVFVGMLLRIFPLLVLWRLVGHQRALRRTLSARVQLVSTWALWLVTIVWTVWVAISIALSLLGVEITIG